MSLRSPEFRIPGTMFFVRLEDGKLIFTKYGKVERVEYVPDVSIAIYKKIEDTLRKYNVFPGKDVLKKVAEDLIKNYKVILKPKEIQLEKDKKEIEVRALELRISQSFVFYVDEDRIPSVLDSFGIPVDSKEAIIKEYKKGMALYSMSIPYYEQEQEINLIFLNWNKLVDVVKKVNLLILFSNMDDPAVITELFELIKELRSMKELTVVLLGFTAEKNIRGVRLSVLNDFCKANNVIYIENIVNPIELLQDIYPLLNADNDVKYQIISNLQEKYFANLTEPVEEKVEEKEPKEKIKEEVKEKPKKEKKKRKGFFGRFF